MNRGPREISVSDELRELLAHARKREGVTTVPTLNLDRVQDVEAALALHFEDDVLAVFAARVPALGVELSRVIGATGDLKRRAVRGDWIGLGELDDGSVVCLSKGRQADSGSVVAVIAPDDESRESMSLEDFVRSRCGRGDGEPGEFVPRLFRPAPESTMQGTRVRHKLFGIGSLLSETGTGPTRKCTVDFPGRGLKLLQARFLEFDFED